MKDKAATSVIIAGKPEEAQSYHIGHGCWQPEDTKLPHRPWLLGNQKKHKATTLAMVARQTEEAQSYYSTSI
jgi:hypothetical protein